MKKLILLSFIGFTLLSCSKNDDNDVAVDASNQELPKVWNSFIGTWKLSQIKRPDGSLVDYVPVCAGKECVIVFDDMRNSNLNYFYNDCTEGFDSGIDGFLDAASGEFSYVPDIIYYTKPISVTSNRFVVEKANNFYHSAFSGQAKGLIFVRK
jgi:hypothetical protein